MNTMTMAQIRSANNSKTEVERQGNASAIDFREVDDLTLLAFVFEKSNPAFAELMRRLRRPVRGKLSSILKSYATVLDSEARDDLMQDFYLRLLDEDMRRLRMFTPGRGKLVTFLRRVMRNFALDFVRKVENRPYSVDIDEVLFEEDNAPEEDATSEGFTTDRRRYEPIDAHIWWLERQALRKAERNARGVK